MIGYAGILLLASLIVNPAPVQQGDAYVRSMTTVPDVTSGEWTRDTSRDGVVRGIHYAVYVNNVRGVKVLMRYRVVNGERQDLLMHMGATNVIRAAIKSDGVWYVARGLFYDRPNEYPQNDFRMETVANGQRGGTGNTIRVTLDTLEGPKSLFINLQ